MADIVALSKIAIGDGNSPYKMLTLARPTCWRLFTAFGSDVQAYTQ